MKNLDIELRLVLVLVFLITPLSSLADRSESFRTRATTDGGFSSIETAFVSDDAVVAAGIGLVLPRAELDLAELRTRVGSRRLRWLHGNLNRQPGYREVLRGLEEAKRVAGLTDWHRAALSAAWTSRHVSNKSKRAMVLYCLLLDQGFDAVVTQEQRGSRHPVVLLRVSQRLDAPSYAIDRNDGSQDLYYQVFDDSYRFVSNRGRVFTEKPRLWRKRRSIDLFADVDRFLDRSGRARRIGTRTLTFPWEGRTAIVNLDYSIPYASYISNLPPLANQATHEAVAELARVSRPLAKSLKRELRLYVDRRDKLEQVRFLMALAQNIGNHEVDLDGSKRPRLHVPDLVVKRSGESVSAVDKALMFIGLASVAGFDTAFIDPTVDPLAGVSLGISHGLSFAGYTAVDTSDPAMQLGELRNSELRAEAVVTPVSTVRSPL